MCGSYLDPLLSHISTTVSYHGVGVVWSQSLTPLGLLSLFRGHLRWCWISRLLCPLLGGKRQKKESWNLDKGPIDVTGRFGGVTSPAAADFWPVNMGCWFYIHRFSLMAFNAILWFSVSSFCQHDPTYVVLFDVTIKGLFGVLISTV